MHLYISRRIAAVARGLGLGLCVALGTASVHAQSAAYKLFGPARLVPTAAGQLAVHEVGHGPKVLVYWPSVLTDHRMYTQQAASLGPEYRQVFIDGPGHGASGAQSPGATLDSHAQAAAQVLDRLGIARAVFIGTSWGGLVGVHLARAQPQRVQALVALNTPFDVKPGGPSFTDRLTVWMARWLGDSGTFADGSADAFFCKTTLASRPEAVALFRSAFAPHDTRARSEAVRTVMLERQSTLPWLDRVSVPVVVVAGKDDPVYPPALSREAAARLPNARVVEIDRAGHLAALETPAEVNAVIVAAASATP